MNSRASPTCSPAGALVGLTALAFAVGRYPVSLSELVRGAGGTAVGANVETVVLQVRGPRVLAALVVGAALAAAGTAYQGMFRNPLVSPDILGVSTGAALGAVLAIFFSQDHRHTQVFAFAGGLAAVGLVYWIGSRLRGHDPLLALVLTGVVIGTLLGSAIALLKYLADPYNQLPAITYWLLGSLAAIAPRDLAAAAPLALLGLAPMLLLRWRMNLLALPDDEARALGVDTRRLRTLVVACATLMTAAAVAISGIIGWVGLLIPHAARLLVGPDFGRLLPLAMLLGAAFHARGRHAVPHHRHHRGAARRAHRAHRHAVLPVAVRPGAEDVVMLEVERARVRLSRPHRRPRRELHARRGEVMCVLGPNGGGKTTLFRTMLGLLEPHGGRFTRIVFAGVACRDARSRAASATCRRATPAYFAFTVREFVLMGRTAHLGVLLPPAARTSRSPSARSSRWASRTSRTSR